jgi:CHASE2 domain-containing sensor protein
VLFACLFPHLQKTWDTCLADFPEHWCACTRQGFALLAGRIILHCVHMPLCLYPTICSQAPRLTPDLWACEYCHNKLGFTDSSCVSWHFHFLKPKISGMLGKCPYHWATPSPVQILWSFVRLFAFFFLTWMCSLYMKNINPLSVLFFSFFIWMEGRVLLCSPGWSQIPKARCGCISL